MSEVVIVTTREDLAAVMAETAAMLPSCPPLSPRALELEELRRKKLLTTEEVQKLYGLSGGSLRNKRALGLGPEYIQEGEGCAVYYEHAAIERYLAKCRKNTHD